MTLTRRTILSLVLSCLPVGGALAQAPFPSGTIKIVVPFGAGTGLDVVARGYAERLADRLEAGNIGINQMCPSLPDMPIGGVKDSGYGYEGGRAGIEAFLHFKLVSTTY